jgi:Cu-Zn family superoxide dismutase
MNNKIAFSLFTAALAAAGAARADYKVEMNTVDANGVGASIGTVRISARAVRGVTFTPQLKGLAAGKHGFHVHETGDCGAKEKDGKMSPAEMAGGHFDPAKTGKHAGPEGEGHKGDLPALEVAANGTATKAVSAEHLALKDLDGKSLMIHEGGDNYSDQPKPLGGGGTRIACGVIKSAGK